MLFQSMFIVHSLLLAGVIEEKGVEGMGGTEEEIAMIEPNVEIEGRGSMKGKEEEGELSWGFHWNYAIQV